MKFKVLSLITVGILLIATAFAGSNAPVLAQDTPAPDATANPCLTTPEATPKENADAQATPEEGADAEVTPVPEATENPCSTSSEATPEATEEMGRATPTATQFSFPTDTPGAPHLITVINQGAFMARYWVTYLDSKGKFVAVGSGEFASGSTRPMTIPAEAFNIGIRVEIQVVVNQWVSQGGCTFAFQRVGGRNFVIFVRGDTIITQCFLSPDF